ncbi:substrate-binding periplasmic protein [Chromobacterium violaceum]|uniref:substrate-binding periplasmic protein n=1 Tax=Chromobacterium violaceum TaxID=536 RepID=UPI0035A6BC0D
MRKWLWLGLCCIGSFCRAEPVINLYTINYPPFVIREGHDHALHGIAIDLLGQALARSGVHAQYVDLPWKRAQLQVQAEENGCLLPLTRSPKREDTYRWVGLMDESSQSLFVAAGSKLQLRGVADLKGLRVVALLGSSMADWLRLHQVAFSELPTTEDAYRELSSGVADVWAVHSPVARYLVKKQGSGAVPVREVMKLQSTGIYLACSRRMPDDLAQKLGAAFKQLRDDGTGARVVAHYLE